MQEFTEPLLYNSEPSWSLWHRTPQCNINGPHEWLSQRCRVVPHSTGCRAINSDSSCHGWDISFKTISKTSTQLKRSRYVLFFFFFFFINKAKKLQSALIRQRHRLTLLSAVTCSCVGYWRSHLRFLSTWKNVSFHTWGALNTVCHLFPVYSERTITRRCPQDWVLNLVQLQRCFYYRGWKQYTCTWSALWSLHWRRTCMYLQQKE
jgi:hypothetical protein